MADVAAKPNLQTTRDRLRSLDLYFLELVARTQAVGSASTTISLPTLQNMAQSITQSVMEVEAWLPTPT